MSKLAKKSKKTARKKAPNSKVNKQTIKKKRVKTKKPPVKKPVTKKPKRDARGRLLPGGTANPDGRPKNTYRYAEWYQEKLNSKEIDISVSITTDGKTKKERIKFSANKSLREVLFAKLIKGALENDYVAIRELLNRSEGKPTQPIVDDSDHAIMEKLNSLSKADLKSLIKG